LIRKFETLFTDKYYTIYKYKYKMTDYKALYEAEVLKRKEMEKKIPELLEAERYKERETNERDWKDLSEEKIEELEEKITCLESDSMNEVSQAEFDDMVEEKDDEIKRLQKYADIMRDIDGDDLTNLLCDHGWEYNDDGELVKESDR
tara:strand:- start:113 stop:553 length:441 start_codon:yes stop_codon:yes gene_type:complete